jgi:hypothetical protein
VLPGWIAFETGRKAWTVVTPARGQILIDTGGINTGGKHRIPLRRERLGAVGLRDADIADEHRGTARKDEPHRASLRSFPQWVFWRFAISLSRLFASARKPSVFLANQHRGLVIRRPAQSQ